MLDRRCEAAQQAFEEGEISAVGDKAGPSEAEVRPVAEVPSLSISPAEDLPCAAGPCKLEAEAEVVQCVVEAGPCAGEAVPSVWCRELRRAKSTSTST